MTPVMPTVQCTDRLRPPVTPAWTGAALQVYSSRIAALESRVLLDSRPQASLTKELHLLSNDLKRE